MIASFLYGVRYYVGVSNTKLLEIVETGRTCPAELMGGKKYYITGLRDLRAEICLAFSYFSFFISVFNHIGKECFPRGQTGQI